ncbi:MAG: DUF7289 family protein [Natronomonas sp.]
MGTRPGRRAQTSPVGIALIIGITLTGATAIVVFGGAALDDTQQESQVSQAEQALTQFDSKVAQVALGEASSQHVDLGEGDGSYRVDPDAGNVRIVHRNYTGNEEGKDEEVYNGSLGAVVYESGGTQLAYQGGGVWRLDESGAARVISPPEFHYRGATLTFPIITVSDGGGSGDRSVRVSKPSTTTIYPDSSQPYEDPNEVYANPVSNGTMVVEIESDYCEGWRSYFISRSDGTISECENGVIEASLETFGDRGDLAISGGTISPRGVGELKDSTITFEQGDDSSDFNNFAWSMYGEDEDGNQFEVYVERPSGGGNMDVGDSLRVIMYFSDDGGDTYETWVNETAFEVQETNDDIQYVTVDMLGEAEMERVDSQTNQMYYDDGETYENVVGLKSPEPIENVTREYFSRLSDIDLETDEKAASSMGDSSTWSFDYDGDGRVITYLHVTENDVEIKLD